ncbi:MAG TPA: DsbE family thiol:disulfide interchange protein [Coxiellaceae bacterium]|nr:DsbE family thiol:disulfide interchange protein [Coxiellaceae bacterium]
MSLGKRIFQILVLVAFLFSGGMFLWQALLSNPHLLPLARLNQPLPVFSAPSLFKPDQKITEQAFKGRATLLNIFATWCMPCQLEQPVLMDIHQHYSIPIMGVLYKDQPENGLQWLKQRGNPYVAVMLDPEGKLGMDLGVYGTPETYLIDQNGIIRYRHIGTLSMDDWQREFVPLIEQGSHTK